LSDPNIGTYFEKQEGAVAEIALALRDKIESIGPELTCKLAWGFPCWSGNERLFSIMARSDRCNLQLFYGNQLAAKWPNRIEGTGKQLRHIKIYAVREVDEELETILKFAVQLDQTHSSAWVS